MKLIVCASLLALLLTLAGGYVVVPILRKLKVGQTLNASVSNVHAAKQGTPTMGGVVFLAVGILVSAAFALGRSLEGHLYLYCIGSTLAFALIGFADDGIKVLLRRNEGLTEKQKLIPQIVLALVFSLLAYVNPVIGSELNIPFLMLR